jgi:hypothetical protein
MESAYGDKNMSCSEINTLIKVVKGEKIFKMPKTSSFLSLLPFRKLFGTNVNRAYIKKVLAKSQPIFKLKRSVFLSLDRFPCRDKAPVHTATSIQDFKWR